MPGIGSYRRDSVEIVDPVQRVVLHDFYDWIGMRIVFHNIDKRRASHLEYITVSCVKTLQ